MTSSSLLTQSLCIVEAWGNLLSLWKKASSGHCVARMGSLMPTAVVCGRNTIYSFCIMNATSGSFNDTYSA